MGIARLGADGWSVPASTPQCLQLEADLTEMGRVSGDCHDMWESLQEAPGGMMDLFFEGEVRDQFVELDLRALRAAAFAAQ
eukprot:322725-Pyramimonas_sp.AAC.1